MTGRAVHRPVLHTEDPARVEILGTPIHNRTMDEVVEKITSQLEDPGFAFTVTPNVDHVMRLRHDRSLRELYESALLVVADGVPLLWAARFLGSPLKERVNGTDLVDALAEAASRCGHSLYLLGGEPGSAKGAAEELEKRYPGMRVAGYLCPPPGFDESEDYCRRIQRVIQRSKADIVLVGLGSPKQERWIADYGALTGARHAIGVGVSFSFISGQKRRAPLLLQQYGLEWLWRLGQEPSRLWRRYLIDDLPFVFLVLWARLSASAERWRRQLRS